LISHKLVTTFLLLSLLVRIPAALADERLFETAEGLSAADFLSTELLNDVHHTVDDKVRNEGYVNYYTIRSDYGEFEAVGTAMLRTRVGEINALGELDELSKTEVFAKAAADAGVKQLKSIQQFATKPVETVKGIPSSVGRMFKRYSRMAGEAVGASKEFVAGDDEEVEGDEDSKSNTAADLTESYMGVDKALIQEYLDNPRMTPSKQTLLTAAIAELEGVGGRDEILRQSLNAETEPEIDFFIKSLTLLAWYHRNQNPVVSVDTSAAIPAGILGNGGTVLAFAVDHVYWTDTIAQVAKSYANLNEAGRPREVWLLGTTSERCGAELAALGIEVHDGVAATLAGNTT